MEEIDHIQKIIIFERTTDGRYFKAIFNTPLPERYNVSHDEINPEKYCELKQVFCFEKKITVYE